jgi:hypothetical protein
LQEVEDEDAEEFVVVESGVDEGEGGERGKDMKTSKERRTASLESLCYEEMTAFATCEELSLRFLLTLRADVQKFLDELNLKLDLVGKRRDVMVENEEVLRAVLKAKREKDVDDEMGVDRIVPARIKIGDFDEVVRYVGGYGTFWPF